jgi:hypothetical protein
MSHKTIQLIIGRLLTDEDFLHDPYETLATLVDQGFELTAGKIDALVQTDRATWMDTASRIDSRLQRASLCGDLTLPG